MTKFRRILHLLAFLTLCGVLMGCATKRGTERTETIYNTSVVHDTLRDSIFINNNIHVRDSVIICQNGDTIFKDRWHIITEYQDRWHDRWKTELKHDTIIKTDSVKVTIEKGLSRWQRLRMGVGNICTIIVFLIVGLGTYRILKK